MKFSLFDRGENYIGNLKNVVEAIHVQEINGRDTLELHTFSRLELGYRLFIHDNISYDIMEFIIADVEEIDEGGKISYIAYCESSFYETMFDYIDDKRAIKTTALDALTKALETTRWTVGHVDDLGEATATFYRMNAKNAVDKILTTWKCELETKVYLNLETGSIVREVNLHRERGGDSGKRLTYKTGMFSINRRTLREDVVTALYGFGKGEELDDSSGYGRRIDFSLINNGKAYLENEEALLEWGRKNPDGSRSHKFGVMTYEDIDNMEKLMEWTAKDLERMSRPRISYEVKAADLSGISRGKAHRYKLGDIVHVFDLAFTPPINHSPRIVRISRNLLYEENTELTLGDREEQESEKQVRRQEIIDRLISKEAVYDGVNVGGGDDGGGDGGVIPGVDTYFDFDKDTKTITKYYTSGKNGTLPEKYDVVIPSTIDGIVVENIGENSFVAQGPIEVNFGAYGLDIISVAMPDTVRNIGSYAFSNNNIEHLTLSNNLVKISEGAFQNNQITNLVLPNSLVEVGDYAFLNNFIQNMNLPVGIQVIGKSAFSSNAIESSIVIPESVTSLGAYSFYRNNLTSFNIPSGISVIEFGVFSENKISDIHIPDHVWKVGDNAFSSQKVPTIINVGSRIIEKHAFYGNIVLELILRPGVEVIGYEAFRGIENSIEGFTSLVMPDTVTEVEMGAFRNHNISLLKLSNNLIALNINVFAYNSIDSVVIPSSVKEIRDYAFRDNNISNVIIPGNLFIVNMGAFEGNPIARIVLNGRPEWLESLVNNNDIFANLVGDIAYPATFDFVEGMGWVVN